MILGYYNYDFLAPSLLGCYMFLLSSIAALIGNIQWQADINALTMFTIIIFLLSIFFGENLARKLRVIPNTKLSKMRRMGISGHAYIRISTFGLLALVLVAGITYFMFYNAILTFSYRYGNPYGASHMLKYARIGMREGGDLNLGFVLTQSIQLCKFLSYVFVYILINNILSYRKVNLLMVVYVFEAWAMNALTSSRGGFINFISAYLIILFCCIMKRYKWNFKKSIVKFIMYAVVALIVFFYVFSLLGNFTGKTAQANGAINQIITYVGGGIISYNDFLSKYSVSTPVDAYESVSGITELLGYIGIKFDNRIVDLEYFSSGILSTNVYTPLRRYIHDFTYIGMVIIGCAIGFFYGTFYKLVKTSRSDYSFALLLYAGLIYPLFYISVDDMFMRGVFSAGTIYMLAYFFVIWLWLEKKYCKTLRSMKNESTLYRCK